MAELENQQYLTLDNCPFNLPDDLQLDFINKLGRQSFMIGKILRSITSKPFTLIKKLKSLL